MEDTNISDQTGVEIVDSITKNCNLLKCLMNSKIDDQVLQVMLRNRGLLMQCRNLAAVARHGGCFGCLTNKSFRQKIFLFFLPPDCVPAQAFMNLAMMPDLRPSMMSPVVVLTQKITAAQLPLHGDIADAANGLLTEACLADGSGSMTEPQLLSSPIQEIEHIEDPSHIEPAEAASVVAVQEACFIEHLLKAPSKLSTSTLSIPAGPAVAYRASLFLIQFHRCPKALPSALSDGLPLKSVREALEVAGCNWKLPTGDMAFVHAHQYRSAVSAYAHDANTFCIICAEDYEYLVDESIMHIGKGAWAKARAELQGLDSNVSEHATIDASSFDGDVESTSVFFEGVMRVQRTFFHYVLALLDGESVV